MFTRAEIEAATVEYLARGGVITRLPDGPQPDAREVRLNEELDRLLPVPWEEVMGEEEWWE